MQSEMAISITMGFRSSVRLRRKHYTFNVGVLGSNPSGITFRQLLGCLFLYMPFFAYILYSPSSRIFYKGSTENIENRIQWHNEGRVNFTSKHRPWVLVHLEEFSTRSEAFRREQFFKSGKGREWIKSNIKVP